MAKIEAILGAMDRINAEMKTVVSQPPEDRNRHIVGLRQEFSAETSNLLCELPGENGWFRSPPCSANSRNGSTMCGRCW